MTIAARGQLLVTGLPDGIERGYNLVPGTNARALLQLRQPLPLCGKRKLAAQEIEDVVTHGHSLLCRSLPHRFVHVQGNVLDL